MSHYAWPKLIIFWVFGKLTTFRNDLVAVWRLRIICTVKDLLLVFQEVSFNMLDAADGGLLNSVRHLLLDIFIPALRATSHGWGELEGLQDTAHVRQEFLSSPEGFVNVLSGAQESLKEKVRMNKLFL